MADRPTLDLTFSAELTAADQGRRTVTGTVVPYGVAGNTSAGPAVFRPGAFGQLDATAIPLVREHDETSPLGWGVELLDDGRQVVGTFRVVRTTAGDDALVEAAEGLRAGLSVGARVTDYHYDDDGQLVVDAAELRHVGLVVRAAYTASTVTNVAANHHDPDHDRHQDQEQTTMPTATDQPAAVTAADVDAAIRAALDARDEAALTVDASTPPDDPTPTIQVTEPDLTAAEYARAVILAGNGDADAQRIVHAALDPSATPGHTGVVPVNLMGEIISTARRNRPTIDRLNRRELPAAGMKFELPRWSTKPVTDVTGEAAPIPTVTTVIDELEVQVVKIAGGNRVSVELIERSSPAYLDELIRELTLSFRQRSNAYAYSRVKAGAVASSAATLDEAFTEAIGDSHAAAPSYVPDVAVGALDQWKAVRNHKDEGGRRIYSASNPVNNQGSMPGNALDGIVEGLWFGLETDAEAGELLAWPSESINHYEQPGSPVTVRVMQVATLEWEVAVYGFLAVAPKHPAAVRQVTVAAS